MENTVNKICSKPKFPYLATHESLGNSLIVIRNDPEHSGYYSCFDISLGAIQTY